MSSNLDEKNYPSLNSEELKLNEREEHFSSIHRAVYLAVLIALRNYSIYFTVVTPDSRDYI